MTAPPPDGPSRRWSIRYLFINAIAAALVPVCLISFVQAYARLERDREVVRAGLTERGTIIVNSSRAVLYASGGADYAAAARAAAQATRATLNAARS